MSRVGPNKTILRLAREAFSESEKKWSYAGAHIVETEQSRVLHVYFVDTSDVERYRKEYDTKPFCGIPIHVDYAAPDWGSQPTPAGYLSW